MGVIPKYSTSKQLIALGYLGGKAAWDYYKNQPKTYKQQNMGYKATAGDRAGGESGGLSTYHEAKVLKFKGRKRPRYNRKRAYYSRFQRRLYASSIPSFTAFYHNASDYLQVVDTYYQNWKGMAFADYSQMNNIHTDEGLLRAAWPNLTYNEIGGQNALSEERYFLKFVNYEITCTQILANDSNYKSIVDVYWLRCYRTVPDGLDCGWNLLTAPTSLPSDVWGASIDSDETISANVAITPYQIAGLMKYWRIYRHEQHLMSLGSVITLQGKFPIYKTFDKSKLISIETPYGGMAGYTNLILFTWRQSNSQPHDSASLTNMLDFNRTATYHWKPILTSVERGPVVDHI